MFIASLRIARISKQDTEKDYILTAYNDQGSEDYRVKISTNPEPKGNSNSFSLIYYSVSTKITNSFSNAAGITKFFRQHIYGRYNVHQ